MNYIIERELVELPDKFFTEKSGGGIQDALSKFCHTEKFERRFKKEKKCH